MEDFLNKKIEDIRLTDLIETPVLQKIQDEFSEMTCMAALITDENGTPLTEGSNFSRFCTDFCRKSPKGRERCEQCDKMGAVTALEQGIPLYYYCHANLIDFAAPIMLDGRMIGSFIGGQVLPNKPNLIAMRKIAREIDVDEEAFVKAAEETAIVPRDAILRATKFIYGYAEVLSEMAYKTYVAQKMSEEALQAATAKTDFLANMSHEIRTPLNAIIGMAQIAMREEMSDAARKCMDQIASSGNILLAIINDILDYSKMESGKMSIIDAEYQTRSLIRDVVSITANRIGNKDIELITDVDDSIPSVLYGDDIRLKQILINLANNAVKFTSHGHVAIRIGYVWTAEDEILIKCRVEDTGIGIKKEAFPKLFASFEQVDSKRNREIEGTGLGLAIVKNLVELMGGKLSVESEYGKGSTFGFELPQKVVDATALKSLDPETPQLTEQEQFPFMAPDARILIVDDNEVNLTVTTGLLEPLGMQMDTATSGIQAVEMISDKRYDLILMDHMMPEVDGVETTRIIRRLHPEYEDVPIIALSANAVRGTREMFLREGMNDFVPKPVDFNDLTGKLRKYLPEEKIKPFDEDTARRLAQDKSREEEEAISVPGLDTEYALRLLGSGKLFHKALKDYYRVADAKCDLIKRYEEQEDWNRYCTEVHALKSASRQIGALALADKAEKLEIASKDEEAEYIHGMTDELLDDYRAVQKSIAPYCEEAETVQKRPASMDLLRGFLENLYVALSNLDLGVIDNIYEDMQKYSYKEADETYLKRLGTALDDIDTEAAEEIVGEWLAQM